jgi:hypothetical protein
VDPFSIVEEFDVVEEVFIDFSEITICPAIDAFFLQLSEKTLDTRVIVRTSAS